MTKCKNGPWKYLCSLSVLGHHSYQSPCSRNDFSPFECQPLLHDDFCVINYSFRPVLLWEVDCEVRREAFDGDRGLHVSFLYSSGLGCRRKCPADFALQP